MIQLLDNEKIVKVVRRHWYVVLGEVVVFIFFASFPLVTAFFLSGVSEKISAFLSDFFVILIFFYMVWLLIFWMIFFIAWTNYYLDVLIVTDKRVIDIEQIGLFSRDIAEMKIKNVQDIRIQVIGILPTLLKYGDLYIQSAGSEREFVMRHIPHPEEVKQVIASMNH